MVWFFGKNKDKNAQNNYHNDEATQSNEQPFFNWKTSSSYSSKKRTCQNDPNDNQYMICKTIIKDNNRTRQQEERIPKNNSFGHSSQSSSSYSYSSSLGFPFSNNNNQSSNQAESQQQKVFNKFPSFFIQPSFFDFHNSNNPQYSNSHDQQTIKSYSYGSKKTCVQDPQDNQYLICKSQINNGKQTKQIEQRVKVGEMVPNLFGGFSGLGLGIGKEFMNFEKQVDKQIHQMMKDINSGIGFLLPFVGHMAGFMNAMNPQNYQNRNRSFQHEQPIHRQHYQRFNNNFDSNYSNQNKRKDTKMYDL